MLKTRIKKEQLRLQQKLTEIHDILQTLPNGKLICCHHKNYSKWYHSNGHTRVYIPKSNRQLAQQLAMKKYLTCLQTELSTEKKALDFYLRHVPDSPGAAARLLTEDFAFHELLFDSFQPLSSKLAQWASESFPANPKHPENLLHKTVSGHMVRSKSEAMIDLFLSTNHIPFRYECELQLDEHRLYPDFTIRHPKTGNYYYWEHFGMMDDAVYCRNAISKIGFYASHGILPSIQLITTYETMEHPLSTEVIQKIIEHYFL